MLHKKAKQASKKRLVQKFKLQQSDMESPIISGPRLPINSVQSAARDRVAEKIQSGQWKQISNNCCCGSCGTDDVLVVTEDRYGLPIPHRLCSSCGIIRAEKVLPTELLSEFYDKEYRLLYTGSGKAAQPFFDEQYRTGQRFINDFLSKIPKHTRGHALEIGCGAGGILKAISDAGWNPVVGVDLGSEYLNFGRAKGLNLIQGDYRELIADESQDLIILSHILEHLPDPEEALKDIAKKMRPGGYLLIEVPGILNLHRSYAHMSHYFQGAHIYNFTLAHLRLLLNLSGFELLAGNERATVLAIYAGVSNINTQRTWSNLPLVSKIHRYLRIVALGERFGLPPKRIGMFKRILRELLFWRTKKK